MVSAIQAVPNAFTVSILSSVPAPPVIVGAALTPASTTLPLPAVAVNANAIPAANNNGLGNNFLLAPAAQALANIATNPAYASMAAALYVSLAIYRSQQASAAALVNANDTPEPVAAVRAVTDVVTGRDQEAVVDRHPGEPHG